MTAKGELYHLGIELSQGQYHTGYGKRLFREAGNIGLFKIGIDQNLKFSVSLFRQQLKAIADFSEGYMQFEAGFSLLANLVSVVYPVSQNAKGQKQLDFIEPLTKGEIIGAHCMTEPNAGSDVGAILTNYSKSGDKFLINGTKTFVTNGSIADIFLVYAAEKQATSQPHGLTCFLLSSKEVKTQSINSVFKHMIWDMVMIDDILTDKAMLLKEEAKGFYLFQQSMLWERLGMAFFHLGLVEGIHHELKKAVGIRVLKAEIQYEKIIESLLVCRSLCTSAADNLGNSGLEMIWANQAKIITAKNLYLVQQTALEIMNKYFSKSDRISNLGDGLLASKIYSGTENVLNLTNRNLSQFI